MIDKPSNTFDYILDADSIEPNLLREVHNKDYANLHAYMLNLANID